MSFIYFLLLYFSGAVEIDFEKNDAAFFIRESNPVLSNHKYIDSLSSSPLSPSSSQQNYRNDSLRPLNQFIITKNNEPISIRASYGPFSSKQSIPFSDFSYQLTSANQSINNENVINAFNSFNTFGVFSIHLVGKSEISFETPTIRVLFHRSKRNVEVCAAVQATFLEDSIGTSQRILLAQCSPDLNEVTCLIEITPAADWWPSIQRKNTAPAVVKEPMRLVDLSYSFLNIDKGKCSDSFLKRQTITYLHFDTVNLVAANGGFKEIRFHDRISILIPGSSIYPSTKILVPIMFDHDNTDTTLSSFYLKARIKNGVKILKTYPGIRAHSFWNITTHLSNKKTSIRIHIVPKNAQLTKQLYSHELQWWLLEISDPVVRNESNFRLFWSIKTNTMEKHKRPFVDFEIQKDDIQAIVPISKSQEILNTAVLNGYQVSQSLKVFIVSYSGKASDVTLQSNCYSENENVLKVSSSCSSVFIDGSENRGSLNASILIKYGTLTGLAKFIVWLPEFPLNIILNDYRLSQIKGWKTEHNKQSKLSPRKQLDDWKFFKKKPSLNKQNTVTNQHDASSSGCKLRFQQTQVEVFARFSASDAETGSTLHYNNHRTFLKITELTTIRISDPKIASIKKNVIQGLNIGRADVQVISPFANNVLASAELRVTGDRVAIVNFTASVISGLQLSIRADISTSKKFLVETTISNILTAKYQEALLDFDLHLQDGTSISLSNVPESDYELNIETLDSSVVAIAPTGLSSSQRIIALSQASGYFLKASLYLVSDCRITSKYSLLANTDVFVQIQFDSMNENNNIQDEINRTEFPQNDIDQDSMNFKSPAFVPSDVIQIPKNSQFSNPSTNKVGRKYLHYQQHFVTPFEIGMYVLLIAFVCGILVFVGSCVIYASKFKPVRPNHIDLTSRNDHLKTRRNFINAHDWVWLGRSTFNSSIADGNIQSTLNNNNNSEDVNQVVNITENPFHNFQNTNRENGNNIELRNYKPPVPPHQNLGIVQLPKRHHKRHRGQKSYKNTDHTQNMYRSDAFHFDDLSPVSFQNSQIQKRNGRIENAVVLRNLNTSNAIEQSSNTNYKQIMHHFHNLKESNA